jgi:excisionase family DNA binding protein
MKTNIQSNPAIFTDQARPDSAFTGQPGNLSIFVADNNSTALRIQDLAKLLKISISMAYKLVERNEVPHYRIGTAIRFDPAEIREWLRAYHRPVMRMAA